MRPGPDGALGLWLAAGPLFGTDRELRYTTSREGDDGRAFVEVRSGFRVPPGKDFELLAAAGRFDLRKSLRAPRENSYALFGGVLRATRATVVWLQLGVDDGVTVTLDGRVVYDRDLWRPPLHDDDAVRLELSAGDHPLLIRLRQRSGDWTFRARLLDGTAPGPARDVELVLPGTDDQTAQSHLAELIGMELFMEPRPDGYSPSLRVTAEGGLPRGWDVGVEVAGFAREGKTRKPLFRARPGRMAVTPRRVHVLQVSLPFVSAAEISGTEGDLPIEIEVSVGGHKQTITRQGHEAIRTALGTIERAGAQLPRTPMRDEHVVRATLELGRSRLTSLVSEGDDDLAATVAEAKQLQAFANGVIDGRDPLLLVRGAMRLAYPSPLDQKNRPFGVYVPPSIGTERAKASYPLVVVLHGLNGLPMQMIRVFFGQDDWRRAPWEDRHVGTLADLDAFVVSPTGFGNLSYREAGEVDVMYLVRWMRRTFPIDENRVYVTGLSMGGTGAAAIGLRHASEFAAMEPLCGYHSYALRRDMANRKLRPWEEDLASFWSNVSWADNGRNLPMYVVHGKKDQPVENSGVLIDRYNALGYRVYAEHPDVGHNVWQQTYEHFKGYHWLARHVREPQPKEVVLKTASLRYADHAWVHVLQLDRHLQWGRVRATVESPHRIVVEAAGVKALRLDRPEAHIAKDATLEVVIDGRVLTYLPGASVVMHRRAEGWIAEGAPAPPGLRKTAGLSGPIHDAFLEPLVFVIGTKDPKLTSANEYVARALASPPYGVEARWPVVADVDVDDSLASRHALFLIGSAESNAYVARIADALPIRVQGGGIVAGERMYEGADIGAMFIHPNPRHPDRYVVVLAAPDVAGTLRALSLPRMLPDFVIYGEGTAGARGQMVLGNAKVVAGGMFDEAWRLPSADAESK